MSRPFLSIITPCYNRASLIGEALDSVIQQNYDHFEHLVMDGGSRDGTQEVVERYPHAQLFSEPDLGLYDALNKGIARAQGKVIALLNSDDIYRPGCFQTLETAFQHTGSPSLCGGVEIFRQEGMQRTILHTFNDEKVKALSPLNITVGIPLTNGRFFSKEVYEKVGPYDLRYKIAADRQWLFRAWALGIKSLSLPQIVYQYRAHEGSLTFNEEALCNPYGDHEYLRICQDFFEQEDLPPAALKACRQWHTWETGYVMVQALKQKSWKKAWEMGKLGWSHDPLWPGRFLCQGLGRKLGLS